MRPVDLRNDVLTLRPNAAGAETNIEFCFPGTGEAHWQDVDEAVADDLSTYVYNTQGYYQRDFYNLPSPGTVSGTINFIKIYFRITTEYGSDSTAKPSLKSDSISTDGTEVAAPYFPTWTTFSQQWNTNPADSAAWEWADIDALQIGISLRGYWYVGGPIYCTQVYVEVDYTPAELTVFLADGYILYET